MGIHELLHLGLVNWTVPVVILLEVSDTDDGFNLAEEYILAHGFELVVIFFICQQEVSVHVSNIVREPVLVDARSIKLLSVLIDRPENLSADLSHSIEWRKVGVFGSVCPIQRLIVTAFYLKGG